MNVIFAVWVICLCLGSRSVWGWNNGLALTPPMGFANWNTFGCNYNDTTIREIADALVSSGLSKLGFEYVLVQECIVPAGHRDANGTLMPDPVKFPYGIPNLVDYIHARGLKAGIYTDVGPLTCAGYEGSFGHEVHDAATFASWGLDLIEADFCYAPANMTAQQLYTRFRDAIALTGRPITFYICNWGEQDPWEWASLAGNMWRCTSDICSPGSIAWTKILYNFDNTVIHNAVAGPGGWNDPDMLGVGMPGINDIEGRSQFSLWVIAAAPLLLGTDVRNMSPTTLATLSNPEIIAISQDAAGWPGFLVNDTGDGRQVYQKRLQSAEDYPVQMAVLLFNRQDNASDVTVDFIDLAIAPTQVVNARDLWLQQDLGTLTESFTAKQLPPHGVVLLRLWF